MKEGDVQKVGISKALIAALEPTLLCLLLEVPLEQATRTIFFYLNLSGDKTIYTLPKKVTPCLESIISFIVT